MLKIGVKFPDGSIMEEEITVNNVKEENEIIMKMMEIIKENDNIQILAIEDK